MKNFNENNFLHDLKIQSWENVYFFADNPNSMWQIWKELFLQVLDKHAPLQGKKIKSKKLPWITNHIKQKLKRRAIVTKLESDWENYKRARNETNTQLRLAKKEYYNNKISSESQNPKAAWKTINSLIGKQNRPTKVNELNINNVKLTSPEDIAKGFNDYFANIGPNLAAEIDTTECHFKDYLKKAESEFTAFKPVTTNHVCF
ncbi:Hypothetical predicted protein, partial [Paramuricea clavata]